MTSDTRKNELAYNLEHLTQEIEALSSHAITLVAVSKYSEFTDIKALYELGHRDFGENRIEDLEKKSQLALECGLDEIRWHFIGHIQSNKIKRIARINNLYLIHSIASVKHLMHFNKEAMELKRSLRVCLQFNCSLEKQKDGLDLSIETTNEVKSALNKLSNLSLVGLMTMASHHGKSSQSEITNAFKRLVELRNTHFDQALKLSMGMSGDFHLALKEGSSIIRVGTRIFK